MLGEKKELREDNEREGGQRRLDHKGGEQKEVTRWGERRRNKGRGEMIGVVREEIIKGECSI